MTTPRTLRAGMALSQEDVEAISVQRAALNAASHALDSITAERDSARRELEQSDKELCQLEDALGCPAESRNYRCSVCQKPYVNNPGPCSCGGRFIDEGMANSHNLAMERIRDLIAAEGELGDARRELEEVEESLRLICIAVSNFDPSDGEGTTPQEVVELVERELESLQKACAEKDKSLQQLEAAQQRIKALEEQGVDLRSKAISCFDSAVTNDATPKGFYLVPDNAMLDLRQAAFSIHPIATEALENEKD